MLTVGDKLPPFRLHAVVGLESGREFQEVNDASYPGLWKVLFLWPMDFTFICPTEIAEFGRRARDFADRDAQVLGASTDTHFVHLAWRKDHADLRDLPFPMLADTRRELSTALGVLHREEGVPLRATFVIDPDGVIRHVSVNDLSVGRNVDEVLRVLDALQTDELCPCNWKQGEATLGRAAQGGDRTEGAAHGVIPVDPASRSGGDRTEGAAHGVIPVDPASRSGGDRTEGAAHGVIPVDPASRSGGDRTEGAAA